MILNDQLIYENQSAVSGPDFLKSIYKAFNISYPKFYKMDRLCKLGFLCAELLLQDTNIRQEHPADQIALILANSNASLESDTEHQHSIQDRSNALASPSVFVYTLPNIVIGEIAIRNQLKGENSFFIFDKFDADFLRNYSKTVIEEGDAEVVIWGWVDYYQEQYDAQLFCMEKKSE